MKAHRDGDLSRARSLYLAVLKTAPDHSSACNNMGLLEASCDQMAAARGWFERALDADPASVDAVTNLAQACIALNDPQAACLALDAALEDTSPETQEVIGARAERFAIEAFEQGNLETAWRLSRLAARRLSDPRVSVRVLAHCLRSIDPRSAAEAVHDDLLVCFDAGYIDHRELARPAAQCLEIAYRWLRQPPERDLIATVISTGLGDDPLFLALLDRSINASPAFEGLLRALRKALLQAWVDGEHLGEQCNAVLAGLALQCFSNEFVWSHGEEEAAQVDALCAQIAAAVARSESAPVTLDDDAKRALCVLAAYRALHRLACHDALQVSLNAAPAPWIEPLVSRLLSEPAEEARLGATLAASTIADGTSRAVQAQYEASPYPRWLNLEPETADTVAGYLSHLFPDLRPPAFLASPVDILIAGCGTGEHALRVATRHPQCTIHGLDLSRASLGYAMRKARELGIENVRFTHGDILSVAESDQRYHVIESVGVIHHMQRPADGLKSLVSTLAPGGVLKLGLYSRQGRRDVRAARGRIKRLGLSDPTPQNLRTFRQRILDGQEPELKALARSLDLYTLSSVRDLLFHVQEHQFDLSEIHTLIESACIMLVGFQPTASVRQRYVARYPCDPWLQSMENLRRFEREHPNAFAGMYQFWCFKPPG